MENKPQNIPVTSLRRIPIYRDKIDAFYGGISDNIRIQKTEIFGVNSHIDILGDPKKLIPYPDMVANQDSGGANGAKAFKITMFRYVAEIAKLYGLGIKTGGGTTPKIYEKTISIVTGDFSASSSGERSTGAASVVDKKCFVDFHKYIYGSVAGTTIWAYGDVTSSPSFTDTATSLGGATAQGLVTTDDLLLIPSGSNVLKKDGAGSGPTNAWTIGLALPANYSVVDICEIGDKKAVFARDNFNKSSKIFIWDGVNSDPDQVIDLGQGVVMLGDNIEGNLVAVVVNVGDVTGKARLLIKWWGGGSLAVQKFELISDDTTLTVYGNHTKILDGNRLIFPIQIKLGGITYTQNFAIGRKNDKYPFSYSFGNLINNDTALTGDVNGQYKYIGTMFVAFNDDGSINRTATTYANTTPTYISQKITGEKHLGIDGHRKRKQFNMTGVLCEPLTAGQSISLYYRVNQNTSWTLIRTYSYGDDAIGMGFEAGVENDGSDYQEFKESQFKTVPLGGAQPIAIIYSFNNLDADVQTS